MKKTYKITKFLTLLFMFVAFTGVNFAKADAGTRLDEVGVVGSLSAERKKAERDYLEAVNNSGIDYIDGTRKYDKLTSAEADYNETKSQYDSMQKKINDLKEKQDQGIIKMDPADMKIMEKDLKNLEKDLNKKQKALEKSQEAAGKKAQKEAAQDLRQAERDLNKAEKELQKAKKNGDPDAIAAAQAKYDAAKQNVSSAQMRVNDYDGSKAVSQAAANLEAAKIKENQARENIERRKAQQKLTEERFVTCAAARDVFSKLTCKATHFLSDVRTLVYVIGGFGLVAFTFKAIFGKMDFKHLGQLGLSLFLLSMMVPFISYFTGDGGGAVGIGQAGYNKNSSSLIYGDFLPYDVEAIKGSSDLIERERERQARIAAANEVKPKDNWTLKDLKGSVQAGINSAKNVYDLYQTGVQTVETIDNNVKAIQNAIEHNPGGLEGVLFVAGNVAAASGNIAYAGAQMGNSVGSNITGFANNITDMTTTNQGRQENAATRASGGQTSGFTSWATNEHSIISKTTGATQQIAETTGKVVNSTIASTNAARVGMTIGGTIGGKQDGDNLGAIFGVATALGEITSGVSNTQQNRQQQRQQFSGLQSGADNEEKIQQKQKEFDNYKPTDYAAQYGTSDYVAGSITGQYYEEKRQQQAQQQQTQQQAQQQAQQQQTQQIQGSSGGNTSNLLDGYKPSVGTGQSSGGNNYFEQAKAGEIIEFNSPINAEKPLGNGIKYDHGSGDSNSTQSQETTQSDSNPIQSQEATQSSTSNTVLGTDGDPNIVNFTPPPLGYTTSFNDNGTLIITISSSSEAGSYTEEITTEKKGEYHLGIIGDYIVKFNSGGIEVDRELINELLHQ